MHKPLLERRTCLGIDPQYLLRHQIVDRFFRLAFRTHDDDAPSEEYTWKRGNLSLVKLVINGFLHLACKVNTKKQKISGLLMKSKFFFVILHFEIKNKEKNGKEEIQQGFAGKGSIVTERSLRHRQDIPQRAHQFCTRLLLVVYRRLSDMGVFIVLRHRRSRPEHH